MNFVIASVIEVRQSKEAENKRIVSADIVLIADALKASCAALFAALFFRLKIEIFVVIPVVTLGLRLTVPALMRSDPSGFQT